MAEGFQSGDIYVNDGAVVEAVFFWHYCGFGYVSGNPSEEFFEEIYKKIISPSERRLVLITSDKNVIEFFQNKDVLIDSRAEYSFLKAEMNTSKDFNSFQIELIDENNISAIEGRINPSFSWKSAEQFLKDGFGYIAIEQGKVCAVAF
ncbi:GNAT family N-acetyltransferase [Pseudobutyrivibrio xylanivorans]|uniref:GNAT family N-acetyltransferase n=1 Tax=Pseudobutyrivibrio xylanivorans TaxID=185007 RepID=A0A5P6VRR8_PSEXY|nr:GNAT family N-acetyltransferase [Pseudobutyrivibrio xylanivorans]